MGKCCSRETLSQEQGEAAAKSKQIDLVIRKTDDSKVPTFIFLGVGGVGKSTLFRVIKSQSAGLTEPEITKLRVALKHIALDSMQTIVNFFCSNGTWDRKDESLKEVLEAEALTPEVAEIIYELASTDQVQHLLAEKHMYPGLHLLDSCYYCLEHCQRFAANDKFDITEKDVAHASKRTTGIEELTIDFNDDTGELSRVRFVDVGGQRQERRRWLDYLQNVTAVIYVTALSDYVNVLEEDEESNRMLESMSLLKILSEHKALRSKLWVLMLNKTDAFRNIVKKVPIKSLFLDVQDEEASSFSKGKQFLKREFKKYFQGNYIKCHFTCAVDADNVKQVFSDVRTFVVKSFFKDISMI